MQRIKFVLPLIFLFFLALTVSAASYLFASEQNIVKVTDRQIKPEKN